MGYYIVFSKLHGVNWGIYHDLVREKRQEYEREMQFEGRSEILGNDYWKEREEKGMFANLKWICDAMERRGFDLIFLTTEHVVFKKRTWWQNLLKRFGVR